MKQSLQNANVPMDGKELFVKMTSTNAFCKTPAGITGIVSMRLDLTDVYVNMAGGDLTVKKILTNVCQIHAVMVARALTKYTVFRVPVHNSGKVVYVRKTSTSANTFLVGSTEHVSTNRETIRVTVKLPGQGDTAKVTSNHVPWTLAKIMPLVST